MQNHVVTKARQFVVEAASLELDFDARDFGQASPQRVEESGRDDQLLLLAQALLNELPQLRPGERRGGLTKLHGGVKSLQQRKTSDIPDEHRPARAHRLHGPFQNPQQVIDAGEILNHRVQDDGIKGCLVKLRKILGGSVQQRHLRHVQTLKLLPQIPQRGGGNVRGVILPAGGREAEQEQARA